MQLITALLFAGLATASRHARHQHVGARQYGGYGAASSNSSSVASASTELSPASTAASLSLSSAVTGVFPSSVGGGAGYPASSVAATGVSSSATGPAPYPTSVGGPSGYPKFSLAGTASSSSVLAPISTGPSIPLTTAASEVAPVSSGSPGASYITHVSDVTLTYTLGYGSSAHAVTTTIKETSTETIVKTVYMTRPASVSEAAATPTSTTTISSTSTTTKFITVYPEASETGNSPTETGTPGEGECAAPVYVTVTAQETVTVTAGYTPATASVAAVESTSEAAVPTSSSAPLFPSAPYGNGTLPSSVYAPSSGFLTYSKPTGTAPVGTAAAITVVPTSLSYWPTY